MKKYMFLITPIVCIVLYLMRHFHILQGVFAQPLIILLITILVSVIIAYFERNAKYLADAKEEHFENLDIMRFLFAIFVMLVHMRPFLGYNDQLDLAFNNIVGRICVPLYFITTGYFCAKKQITDPTYIKRYLRSMLPFYLLWSLLYLPFGLDALSTVGIELPPVAWPFAAIVGIVYVGTYYHLWYFPALFFALFILDKWQKHFSLKILLGIALLLLCFGATETYYGMLPEGLQVFLSTYYFKIFYTTRNFLFFGLFYVTLGYVIGRKDKTFVPYSFLKFLLCSCLLIVEAYMLQSINRLDSNIMLSCVPLSYYLFLTLIYCKPLLHYRPKISYRDYYKYYFLLHPIVILAATHFIFSKERFESHYWLQIAIVLAGVQLLTMGIVKLKKRFPKKLRWL